MLKAIYLLILFVLFHSNAFSCIGGVLELNDDTILYADGVYAVTSNTKMHSQKIANNYLGKTFPVADASGEKTHYITFLGAGIIPEIIGKRYQAFYLSVLVKEISSGREQAYFLKKEKGLRSGGSAAPKSDSRMNTLTHIGC
jgi:hypothetical protein